MVALPAQVAAVKVLLHKASPDPSKGGEIYLYEIYNLKKTDGILGMAFSQKIIFKWKSQKT